MSHNAEQPSVKSLYDALCLIIKDIENLEITAGNKEQVRNSLLERINALPFTDPYQISDLQPDADATLKSEIEQMKARLQRLKQRLEHAHQL